MVERALPLSWRAVKKIPKIRPRQTSELFGKRIVVSIDAWDRISSYSTGHFVTSLGELDTKEAETETLLLDRDGIVLQDPEDHRLHQRADYCELLVCGVDPPGCQDSDDAFHANRMPDVTFSPVRVTTIYFADKRINILPRLLDTALWLLKPYVERFAFSVLYEITENGDVWMRTLLMLSKKLRQKRMDVDALNLASPEVEVESELETSDSIDVKTKKMLGTNSLVAGSKALADSHDRFVNPSNPFYTLVRIWAKWYVLSAEYFSSDTQGYPEFQHYGLMSEIYTHFTSPIRRYADVVAHRQLAAAIGYEPLHPTLHSKMASVGCCVGQALYGKKGFMVFAPRFGVEGLNRVRDLAPIDPKSGLDAVNYTLTVEGSTGSWSLGLFDRVVVKVMGDGEERGGKRKIKKALLSVTRAKVVAQHDFLWLNTTLCGSTLVCKSGVRNIPVSMYWQ
ncbi:mitotic control protein dis3 [Tuber brumale]|nr:mitotic control protein dis3 [Tuber brumale]